MFNPDEDNETLPPGVVSREAGARALQVTKTEVPDRVRATEAATREQFMSAVQDPDTKKLRTKWTAQQVHRLATDDAWDYGWRHGHMDAGTVASIGNLLLQGMSTSAVRKALGITPNTWSTWMSRGTGDEVGTQRPATTASAMDPLPQAPYSAFVFVVENSQAVMELRAVKGWTASFDRDWRAAQAFLVARNPEEWNPVSKSKVEHSATVDQTVRHVMGQDQLLEVAAILQNQGVIPQAAHAVVLPGGGGGTRGGGVDTQSGESPDVQDAEIVEIVED